MIDDGLFDRFPKPEVILGQHVMPHRPEKSATAPTPREAGVPARGPARPRTAGPVQAVVRGPVGIRTAEGM
jgi:hypothetical protein